MNEFVFGGLSSLEHRVAHVQAQREGVRHHYRLQPQAPRAGDAPTITVTTALPAAVEGVRCTLEEPEPGSIELRCTDTRWDTLAWSYYQVWQARLPAHPAGTIVRYRIEAYAGATALPADEGETFSYLVGEPGPPAWAQAAVVYQILPDRFHPGRGRAWRHVSGPGDIYGGTLRGIIEHLDYVADLGFNCIWLNPFFPGKTHHGYHATDYFQVNPRLGTLDDIRELVAQAHARDIRLLLDFVANHWSRDHPTFQAALADRNSDYYDWYTWEAWPERYKTFFGVQELPQINLEHPAARAHLLRAAAFWSGDIGFDGYRLDYALGPSHDFWTDFRAAVKGTRPDAWLFGEVVEAPPVQLSYDGRLDGCLDFLLMQALRDTFIFGTMSVAALDGFLRRHHAFFPEHFSRPSFLDNHDVDRFLWLARGDKRKLKLAALCQFTLTGSPIVYYGTEVGLSQERDVVQKQGHILEESRLPMLWGEAQDQELHRFYRRLIDFRRSHPALWRGQRETAHVDGTAGTYVYTCRDEHETIVVALNASDEARTVEARGHTFSLAPWQGDVRVAADG